jgi:hypothetical protein
MNADIAASPVRPSPYRRAGDDAGRERKCACLPPQPIYTIEPVTAGEYYRRSTIRTWCTAHGPIRTTRRITGIRRALAALESIVDASAHDVVRRCCDGGPATRAAPV